MSCQTFGVYLILTSGHFFHVTWITRIPPCINKLEHSHQRIQWCRAMRCWPFPQEILESTFGHLAHIVGNNSTNKSLAASAKWMYLTSSPYVKASGMPQPLPRGEDWIQWIGEYGQAESECYRRYNKGFKASSTPVPTSQMPKTSKGVLKTEWRLSGPASHYSSSAAMAYLMHDSDENFAHVDLAWSGLVETNKHQSSWTLKTQFLSILWIVTFCWWKRFNQEQSHIVYI